MTTAYCGIIIACAFLPAILVAICSMHRMDKELIKVRAQNAELGGALSSIINSPPNITALSLRMIAEIGIHAADEV